MNLSAGTRPRVRALTAIRALAILARDPNRLDRVFALGEAVNAPTFPSIRARMLDTEDGTRVLAERPSIDTKHVDFPALEALPDGTLGREYARFLRENAITPDVFRPPASLPPDAAYIAQRIRQQHDVWHVLTGYATDVRGEILLQAFTFGQLRIPSSLLIAVAGALRIAPRDRAFAARVYDAYRDGTRARFLAGTYWEEHWAGRVTALRARFGIAFSPA